jgi:hypothetical protein
MGAKGERLKSRYTHLRSLSRSGAKRLRRRNKKAYYENGKAVLYSCITKGNQLIDDRRGWPQMAPDLSGIRAQMEPQMIIARLTGF